MALATWTLKKTTGAMMTDRSPFLGMLQKAQELHFPEIVPEDYFQ